jgi:3-oxoacyl-[acyl-carrier protein] reductase
MTRTARIDEESPDQWEDAFRIATHRSAGRLTRRSDRLPFMFQAVPGRAVLVHEGAVVTTRGPVTAGAYLRDLGIAQGLGPTIDDVRVNTIKRKYATTLMAGAADLAVKEARSTSEAGGNILVVNHALSRMGKLSELTADDLDAHLHVNVRASLLLVKEFAARHDGRPGGRVCLLTSGQDLAPMAGEVAYAASKGAIQQITPTLADALADRSVTVNAVNPGPTDTGWAAGLDPGRAMPFGRWGSPDDAARLIAWLCSEDGGWVTGQVIDSEGGFRRWAL